MHLPGMPISLFGDLTLSAKPSTNVTLLIVYGTSSTPLSSQGSQPDDMAELKSFLNGSIARFIPGASVEVTPVTLGQ